MIVSRRRYDELNARICFLEEANRIDRECLIKNAEQIKTINQRLCDTIEYIQKILVFLSEE